MQKSFIFTLAAFAFTSCSTKFTPAQMASLSSIAIAPASVKYGAYQEPHGGSPTSGTPVVTAPGNPTAGAVGNLIGQLLIEGISAAQDNMFEKAHKHNFPAVERNTPQIPPLVAKAMKQQLAKDAFFGPRLSTSGTSRIETEVLSYGLVRTGKHQKEILLTPSVLCQFSLRDSAGKILAQQNHFGIADSQPITWYASSRSNSQFAYDKAVNNASMLFTDLLKKLVEP
jgi:hypothetical protein